MINSNIRVFDLLGENCKAKFIQHNREGVVEITYRHFIQEARELAKGLMSIGICKGDSVLLQLKNGYEWNLLDRAIQMVGAIQVSLGVESENHIVRMVVEKTMPRCCFTDSPFCKRRLENLLERLSIRSQVQLVKNGRHLTLFETASGSSVTSSDLILSNRMAEVSSDDTACIIYTSGTTGEPKGVMITHRNLVTSITTFANYLGLMQGCKTLSLLPLSFSGERKMNYAYQYLSYEIHYTDLREGVIHNCNRIKPEIIAVVPYLLSQILEQAQFGRDNWLPKTIVCGGASVDPFIIQRLGDFGVEVFEVYGLTETTSLLAVNFPENVEAGTVGKPLKEIEVMLSDIGEVLTRGAHVAKGYVGREEFPLDRQGWFHTGDIGFLTTGGYLKLTGRSKNRIRLSKGLDIAPEPIEAMFRANENVHNVFLFGRNRDALVAIVQARANDDSVDQNIDLLVMEHNGSCKLIEQIENYRIVTDDWNASNGLLTPSGKLNRPTLEKKYADLLLEMYDEINSRTF